MRRRRGPIDRLDVLVLVIGTGFATFIFSILVSTSITSSLINDKHKADVAPRQRGRDVTSAEAKGHGGPTIQEPVASPTAGEAVARRSPPTSGHRRLFAAILQIESGGNNQAVGDSGQSRGPYQISLAYWQDACEFGKVDWDYDECVWSRSYSEVVMDWYWARYGATTDEQRARQHNGGPEGPSRHSTEQYWLRVQALMQRTE